MLNMRCTLQLYPLTKCHKQTFLPCDVVESNCWHCNWQWAEGETLFYLNSQSGNSGSSLRPAIPTGRPYCEVVVLLRHHLTNRHGGHYICPYIYPSMEPRSPWRNQHQSNENPMWQDVNVLIQNPDVVSWGHLIFSYPLFLKDISWVLSRSPSKGNSFMKVRVSFQHLTLPDVFWENPSCFHFYSAKSLVVALASKRTTRQLPQDQ